MRGMIGLFELNELRCKPNFAHSSKHGLRGDAGRRGVRDSPHRLRGDAGRRGIREGPHGLRDDAGRRRRATRYL
ncbi:hypothetical protein PF003_g23864 [Phytophthora fragariae]|nr:hypothetical protein PF003_g23864 [Phytophthora fragariae]